MIDLHEMIKLYEMNTDFIDDIVLSTDKNLFPYSINEKLRQSKFCHVDIYDYSVKCNNYLKIISKNKKILYHILWFGETNVCMSALIKSLRQALLIHEVFKFEKALNVYIILSPFKRFLPDTKTPINCQHINGGFTSSDDNDIFVVRSEEFSKVVIHELLHHCKLIDNHQIFGRNNINSLKKEFKIAQETILLPNEAVVEFWATILNNLFLSLDYKIPFDKLLDLEKHFCIIQYHKILNKQNGQLWKEYTNSYSYIIFKTILLYNYKELLKTTAYPYDVNHITNFILSHKNSIPSLFELDKIFDSSLFSKTRSKDSLRMMYLSDY